MQLHLEILQYNSLELKIFLIMQDHLILFSKYNLDFLIYSNNFSLNLNHKYYYYLVIVLIMMVKFV